MTSSAAHPIAEFRDVDHYYQSFTGDGHDIIRPKPRRPGDVSASESPPRLPPRDAVGGSAPVLRSPTVGGPACASSGSPNALLSPPKTTTNHVATPAVTRHLPVIGNPAAAQRSNAICSPPNVYVSTPHLTHGNNNQHHPRQPNLEAKLTATGPNFANNHNHGHGHGDCETTFNVAPQGAESTDYGSLSKSSSDGGCAVANGARVKRVAAPRPKWRRRNTPVLCLGEEVRLGGRRSQESSSSSSDENRSSGHASMSDGPTTSSSSPPSADWPTPVPCRPQPLVALKSVPEDETSVIGEPELRLESGAGLEDIRQAIAELTLRARASRCSGPNHTPPRPNSYSTSTYSSLSSSETDGTRHPLTHRKPFLLRHSSLESSTTTGPSVAAGDEFAWLDAPQRLVEVHHPPWNNADISRALRAGRARAASERLSAEAIPRLGQLLQRALVRIAREAQRLSRPLGACGRREIAGALRVVLATSLADGCVKAGLRAAAMLAAGGGGEGARRQSKSARAGVVLSVGRLHRWMKESQLGRCVHEHAAVHLAAALENILEEMSILATADGHAETVSAAAFELALAASGELWGLLQPFAHLNAGRIASGTLALPRWPSSSSASSSSSSPSNASETSSTRTLQQNLLTTCVGSVNELGELVAKVTCHVHRVGGGTSTRPPPTWTPIALRTLFYFMRCSQLELAERGTRGPTQELNYERPYMVLPPLVEWVRVSTAHGHYRGAELVDGDDVMQAARLLLPGIDCPVRAIGYSEVTSLSPGCNGDAGDISRRARIELAFRLLTSGRSDLVSHAIDLLPSSTRLNTLNDQGMSALMVTCVIGNETTVRVLLEAGADPDAETPPSCAAHSGVNPESQHWTAVTYATSAGHLNIVKLLLEWGASVEGGGRAVEDRCTWTPLQLASAAGDTELVALLLARGADPFLATDASDPLRYGGAAPRGAPSPVAVAAAHGQRAILHALLAANNALGCPNPRNSSGPTVTASANGMHGEVLSLEEILAEGARQPSHERRVLPKNAGRDNPARSIVNCSKLQMKALHEALYQSLENGYWEIAIDLRNYGVSWTLHCWLQALLAVFELQVERVVDQLLQDFVPGWADDPGQAFVEEGLPLLFTIFRDTKSESTSLLLADVFCTCYGKEAIPSVDEPPWPTGGARIDPEYVNNPELSDVQFRVEGRLFYGHKIILVNASPRFKSMLSSRGCTAVDGVAPVIHINDIRYHIFQVVMEFLYKGGCDLAEMDLSYTLEVMAAAHFFQLDNLLQACEARCARLLDQKNVVTMYLLAKAYDGARLIDFCRAFMLQNLVTLLTYDDGARRLIFGKKLHSLELLAGLLTTLQSRVRGRTVTGRLSRATTVC